MTRWFLIGFSCGVAWCLAWLVVGRAIGAAHRRRQRYRFDNFGPDLGEYTQRGYQWQR